jgi:uncharacterized protein
MPLILNGLPPLHWALAGVCIAAITLALLFLGRRRLGISGGFDDVCGLVLASPYFTRPAARAARQWRLPFLAGLVLGGFLSASLSGGWHVTWALGMFDSHVGWGHVGKVAWMFAGGLLIGFGTRLGGGCTSGHGIFGVSNLERASIVSTISFLTGGFVTTQLLFRVLFR